MTESHQPADVLAGETDPWERYGWLMGAVWLIFLLPSLAGVMFAEVPVWARVLAVLCVLVFATVYVVGLRRMYEASWSGPMGAGVRYVLALTSLAVAAVLLAGETALGTAAFIVAFSMFALPLRAAIGLALSVIALTLALPWLADSFSHSWYVAPVVLTVGLATGVVRVLEGRQARFRTLADEVALAAERDRVARDVHDVLGHSLTVVTVKAELAERLVDIDPARARAELAEIQSLTRQSLAEIRATVAGLRVARLTEELESAAGALSDAGLAYELPEDPSVADPRHRIVLAWALREAVTNVIRHSGAATCRVTLGESSLDVVDDGRGIDGRKEGNGLRGLRERVSGAGGTVELRTPPAGSGTWVQVRL